MFGRLSLVCLVAMSAAASACAGRSGDSNAHVPEEKAPAPSAAPVASAPPARADATPRSPAFSELDELARVPAWDGLIVGGSAIVLEPDFLTLAAYDVKTGALKYRTKVLEQSRGGRFTLEERGGELWFWADRQMLTLDPATGKVTSTQSVPANGDCSFVERGAACAFACGCSLQVVDCHSAKPFESAFFKKTYVEMWDAHGGSPHAGCFGHGTTLVGGNGRTTVVLVEDETEEHVGHFSKPLILLGLDAKTGKERWRRKKPPGSPTDEPFTKDGRSFFLYESDSVVSFFDTDTGKPLWSSPAEADIDRVKRHFLSWVGDPPALFRYAEDEAFLHDAKTGRPFWRAKVPAGAFAVPEGAHIPSYDIETHGDPALDLLILDPKTGKTSATLRIPPNSMVRDDPSGGFYVLGEELVAYGPDAKERARAKRQPVNAQMGPDFVVLFDGQDFALLDREKLRIVHSDKGNLGVKHGSSLAGGVLLYEWKDRGAKVGEARLLVWAKAGKTPG